MSRTAADTIQMRLVDRCAKLFAFAFQLRQKSNQHAAGAGDQPDGGPSGITPLGGKRDDTPSMSGLPDLRDDPSAENPFQTIPIAAFTAEQLQQAAGDYDATMEAGYGNAGPAGISESSIAECDELQLRVDSMFRELDKATAQSRSNRSSGMTLVLGKGKKKGTSMNDVQLAKYALAAFIDEIVLFSQLPIRDAWASKPLQLEYFDDFNAGEAFYLKIDELRNSDDPRSVEVLEVYYACLVHGFRGRFNDRHGMEKRKVLIETLARDIGTIFSRESGGSFAPRAMPPDELPQAERRVSTWMVPGICLIAFVLLYILFSSLLGGQVSDVLDTLNISRTES